MHFSSKNITFKVIINKFIVLEFLVYSLTLFLYSYTHVLRKFFFVDYGKALIYFCYNEKDFKLKDGLSMEIQ